MQFERLNKPDGTWKRFEMQWEKQCNSFGEDFIDFAASTISTLNQQCDETSGDENSGVFALKDKEGTYHSANAKPNTAPSSTQSQQS